MARVNVVNIVIICNMIDLSLSKKLSCSYKSAYPFPYVVIDNFLPKYLLERSLSEIIDYDKWFSNQEKWVEKYQVNKFFIPDADSDIISLKKEIPFTTLIIDYLNSKEFLEYLKELTGHDNLYCDPILLGGGVHKIKKGGKLSVHYDYNTHPGTLHKRKLNLLIYMNKNWKKEYNGNLELWERDLSRKIVDIEPIFNRAVLFDVENAPHCHPIPLDTPDFVSRYSLALYYFVEEIPNEQKPVFFIDDEWLFRTTDLK